MISTCFVIMGFNIKTNEDGKEYNLDLSYSEIIKPVLDFYKLNYVRADEIMIAEMIDDSMYKFLLSADLVIADITTLNANALYELGVRYALKPYSTIIIGSTDTKIPFDLSHVRIFRYKHDGAQIKHDECIKIIGSLKTVIKNIMDNTTPLIDSPVYKFLSNLEPPRYKYISDTNYFENNIKRFKSEESLGSLIHFAYQKRDAGCFKEAITLYKKALKISKDEYIIKEIAVCMYQEGTYQSYYNALNFLNKNIKIESTINPEVLKTLGTIYKNLWLKKRITEFVDQALACYEKSFILLKTYNSGLNYGFMLLVMSYINQESINQKFYMWSQYIYSKTKEICLEKYDVDDYWTNASLAECCLVLDEKNDYKKYLELSKLCYFETEKEKKWKNEKTRKQLNDIKKMIQEIKYNN